MTITTCNNCGGDYQWSWEDAFDKFGFNDGDGQVETFTVMDTLEQYGYQADSTGFGCHNEVITSIKHASKQLMPDADSPVRIGYDDPREYLPAEIIELLDFHFPG